MGFGLAALAGGALGGLSSYFGAKAQGKAAKKQLGFEREAYQTQRELQSPYQQYGLRALGMMTGQDQTYTDPRTGEQQTIAGTGTAFDYRDPEWDTEYTTKLADYASSPAFRAQNQLAQQALGRRMAARGLSYGMSGARAGAELEQQLIASDYDKYRSELANRYNALRQAKGTEYQRLMDAINVGRGGAASLGSAASEYGHRGGELAAQQSMYGTMAPWMGLSGALQGAGSAALMYGAGMGSGIVGGTAPSPLAGPVKVGASTAPVQSSLGRIPGY